MGFSLFSELGTTPRSRCDSSLLAKLANVPGGFELS
jgi:hypothetical protein